MISDEIKMTKSNIKERAELLEAMDTIIKAINNENAYYGSWLVNGPGDEATKEDYESTAELIESYDDDNSCYDEACKCFTETIINYARSGYYAGKVLSAEYTPKQFNEILLNKIDNSSKWYDLNDPNRIYVVHEIRTIYEFLTNKSSEGLTTADMIETLLKYKKALKKMEGKQ